MFHFLFKPNGGASHRSLGRQWAASAFCGIQLSHTAITRLKWRAWGRGDGRWGVAGRAHLALDWL